MPTPLSIFGTAAAAGGGGAYEQNLIDASAPAMLEANNVSGGAWTTEAFTMSLWFNASGSVSNRTLFRADNGGNPYRAVLGLNGTSNLNFTLIQNNNSRFNITTGNQISTATDYHVLVSFTNVGPARHFYVNDVEWSASGSTSTGPWQPTNWDRWMILGFFGGSNQLAPNPVSDVWVEQTYIDITVEANRRKFINADLTPVDLGANGELPTGSAPFFYYGSDYVAADWNSGVNLGDGPDLTANGVFADA